MQILSIFLYYFIGVGAISIFGIVGNILCAWALSSRRVKESWSTILVGLLLFNTTILVTYFVLALLIYSYAFQSLQKDDLLFLLNLVVLPLNKTALTGSAFTILLLAFERYFMIRWPPRTTWRISTKTSGLALGLILQFAFVFNLPRWLEVSLEYNSQYYILYYHGWVSLMTTFAIPVLVITVIGLLTWKQIRLSKARGTWMTTSEQYEFTNSKMCLFLLFIFCVANTIYSLTILHYTIYRENPPFVAELLACGPVAINSSITFVLLLYYGKVPELRAGFAKFRNWLKCKNSNTLRDPANATRTILDTEKIEITSFKFNVRFDDCDAKYVITNSETKIQAQS